MSYLFYRKEDIENIKSLLKDNLGIQYALPDYNLSKGRKVHIMVLNLDCSDSCQFDQEDIKGQYPDCIIVLHFVI